MGILSHLRKAAVVPALYMAAALSANPAVADPALEALRAGDMRKLVVHAAPRAVSQAAFFDREGGTHRLEDWRGDVVVLNFWATWCPPCRAEMPALDAMQQELDGKVRVLTVATGRNHVPAIEKFFADTGVAALPILLDPRSALARDMGVAGLPVTVVLDREGQEVARMIGEADWNTAEAHALLKHLAAR